MLLSLGFGITAVASYYLANQPETQALIEKSRSLQQQYEQQKANANKAVFVIPSVGEVQVSFNIEK